MKRLTISQAVALPQRVQVEHQFSLARAPAPLEHQRLLPERAEPQADLLLPPQRVVDVLLYQQQLMVLE